MKWIFKSIKRLWGKQEMHILTVFAISIIIPITAMLVLTRITQNKLEKDAKTEAEVNVKSMSRVFNVLFDATEWVANSFIANLCDMKYVTDSVSGENYVTHIVHPARMQRLTKSDYFALLSRFVNYNNEFYSATLILKPELLSFESGQGVAITMSPNDPTRRDLMDEINVFDDPFYVSTASSKKATVKYGKTHNNQLVVTYAIPLVDSAENVLGEFWLDCAPNAWNNVFANLKSDDDIFIGAINNQNTIVLTADHQLNGAKLEQITENLFDSQCAQNICKIVQKQFKEKHNFEFSHNGKTYYAYLYNVKLTDFKLLVIKSADEVNQSVKHYRKLYLWMMLGSFLLMLYCAIYAFRTFKKRSKSHFKMQHELQIATSIQRSFLPANPTAPESKSDRPYDIFGFLRPAKSIGGDLYDYAVKDGHLYFCIGDVCGKGVPAALVMSQICSLFRLIIRRNSEPQAIISALNNAMLERSDDSVMCTLFVGVINLENGHFEFCNAGHNPPILVHNGEAAFMKTKPNMPACVFENYPYQKESIDLQPGDRLFAYTDGIPEAKNGKNEFFGAAKTLNLLQDIHQLPFNQLVDNILHSLDKFSAKAAQHDDITILCLEYRGNRYSKHSQSVHYDKVRGKIPSIVTEIVTACGLENDMRLRLAVEEPVQNIADYAYPEDGPLDILIENDDVMNRVTITLADSGTPFNPLEIKKPDLTSDIMDRELGGLGIHFTRQMMEEISYIYENQQNKLILKYNKNGN